MNLQNYRLRLRLLEIAAIFPQIDDEIHGRSKTRSSRNHRLQKERQRRLNNEKIAIQQALDLIVYPILTIPVEITSEIFVHCLPDEPQRPSISAAPMLLGAVCREWRLISRGNPRLWAALKMEAWFPGHRLLLKDCLLRAGSMLSSLSITFPHAHERCCGAFFGISNCGCVSSWPSAILWQHLTMFCGDFFTPSECLAVLRRAPQLIRCEFRNIEDDHIPLPFLDMILLSRLEYLTLACHPDDCCSTILRSLDLPVLCTLDLVSKFLFDDPSFISFLRRSSSIQTFNACFEIPELGIENGVASSVFSVMPSLTTLHIESDKGELIYQILPLLAKSPSFLPRLQVFKHTLWFDLLWTGGDTDTLAQALAARWKPPVGVAQLRDFRLIFPSNPDDYASDSDDDDSEDIHREAVAELLQPLMKGGMKLIVGPLEAPWV